MKNKPWLLALFASLIFCALIAYSLYYFSEQFFKAKNKQTLITSSDLGNDPNEQIIIPVGEEVPKFKLKEISSSRELGLENFNESILIINFWASWCEPCVEEFSSFSRLLEKYSDTGHVQFLAVGEDKKREDAETFLKAFAVDFKNLSNASFVYDPNKKVLNSYGVLALPETFIVGPDGKLIRRITGFENWDQDQVYTFFDQLVKKYNLESQGRDI